MAAFAASVLTVDFSSCWLLADQFELRNVFTSAEVTFGTFSRLLLHISPDLYCLTHLMTNIHTTSEKFLRPSMS